MQGSRSSARTSPQNPQEDTLAEDGDHAQHTPHTATHSDAAPDAASTAPTGADPPKPPHEPGSLRQVAHVSWPIVVGMLSHTAMGVSDTLFVGWLGTAQLAAVGLATTATFLINAFAMGLLGGVKIVAAQATGAGKHTRAEQVAWLGALAALPLGALVIALSLFDAQLFALLGGSDEIQTFARTYFNIRVFASPLSYITLALCNYYQGTGDTRTPMKVNLMINGLNIALNALLIFGWGPIPALGVEGAALATVLASGVGMGALLARFVHHAKTRPSWSAPLAWETARLGFPIALQSTLATGSWTVVTSLLARMGAAELAAHQISIKLISVSFLPGYGISEAACILVGQHVGARERANARRAFRSAAVLASGVMGALGLLFWLFPAALMAPFKPSPEVVDAGVKLIQVAAIFQLVDALAMTAAGALKGAGDTRFVMLLAIGCSWLVLLPTAWLLGVHMNLGALGVWMAITCEIVIFAAIALARVRSDAWLDKAIASLDNDDR